MEEFSPVSLLPEDNQQVLVNPINWIGGYFLAIYHSENQNFEIIGSGCIFPAYCINYWKEV